ncbi:unnamed protein product [Rhizophagus irregularis]|nr:unnamed protein product [Rhizophagus irregularis]
MLTITETAPSVFNSSVFAEHRLSTIPDSFDGSLLTDMAPISNITLQKNNQTNMSRSENLTSHKRRQLDHPLLTLTELNQPQN